MRGLEELAREVQALERGGLSLQLLDLTVKEGTVLAWAHFSEGEVLLRFSGADPEVEALLREGRLEEAAKRLALSGIAGV